MLTSRLIVSHHARHFVLLPAIPLSHYPHNSFSSNSFICHTSEISPVIPTVATDPTSPFPKSFVCHTCEPPPAVPPVPQPTSPPSPKPPPINPSSASFGSPRCFTPSHPST